LTTASTWSSDLRVKEYHTVVLYTQTIATDRFTPSDAVGSQRLNPKTTLMDSRARGPALARGVDMQNKLRSKVVIAAALILAGLCAASGADTSASSTTSGAAHEMCTRLRTGDIMTGQG
jgi:hypothetical protein